MFDLLKRRAEPAVPFEFGYGVRIEKPAAEVYALLDWADPRNAKRALGNKVEQVGTSPDRFRMTLDIVPGHVFEMIVTEAVPGARYAFDNEITPPPGKLVASHERYTIEPAGETACVLTLRVFASFAPRLAEPAIAMEVANDDDGMSQRTRKAQGPGRAGCRGRACDRGPADGLPRMSALPEP